MGIDTSLYCNASSVEFVMSLWVQAAEMCLLTVSICSTPDWIYMKFNLGVPQNKVNSSPHLKLGTVLSLTLISVKGKFDRKTKKQYIPHKIFKMINQA
jgi:hypothetical protein